MKKSEQFALNQWLCNYPDDMSFQEIIDIMTGLSDFDDEWIYENLTVWQIVENLSLRHVAELITDTAKAFERAIND